MRHVKIKQFALLLGLVLSTVWCVGNNANLNDGYSHINVKEAHVQGHPKGSSIQASINGTYDNNSARVHAAIVVYGYVN